MPPDDDDELVNFELLQNRVGFLTHTKLHHPRLCSEHLYEVTTADVYLKHPLSTVKIKTPSR